MKGLVRSLGRGAPLDQIVSKILLKPRRGSATFTVDGATGIGFGTVVLGGLPQGNILLLGAVSYMSAAGPGGDAGLVDTWAGDYSIGTTPADDGTLTAADIDIIDTTALAAATAEVSPRTRAVPITPIVPVILDNTDGSLEVNYNVLVDDANISADAIPFTVEGEVWISFVMLGDD